MNSFDLLAKAPYSLCLLPFCRPVCGRRRRACGFGAVVSEGGHMRVVIETLRIMGVVAALMFSSLALPQTCIGISVGQAPALTVLFLFHPAACGTPIFPMLPSMRILRISSPSSDQR